MLAVGVVFVLTRGGPQPDHPAAAPSVRRGLASCAAGDLVAGPHAVRAAAGTTYLTATLVLAPGVEPCTVEGRPRVIVLSGGRPAGVPTVADEGLGEARPVTVLPDRSAKVTLGWAVSHYCGPVDNDAIRLLVAPGLSLDVPGFGATSCNPGEGRPPLRVGPYSYVDPTADRATVTGVVTLNGGPALGTGEFATAGEVVFVGAPDSYRASIGTSGGYRVELPAGRYRVTVSTHQWNGGAPYSAGVVDVVSGQLNELNFTLPVR